LAGCTPGAAKDSKAAGCDPAALLTTYRGQGFDVSVDAREEEDAQPDAVSISARWVSSKWSETFCAGCGFLNSIIRMRFMLSLGQQDFAPCLLCSFADQVGHGLSVWQLGDIRRDPSRKAAGVA
jgi:hypothetical protein